MKKTLTFLLLSMVSISALASVETTTQEKVKNVINWKMVDVTASQLITDGYELKSVNLWIDTELLYLQKGNSLYRCGTMYGKTKKEVESSKCEKLSN